MIDPLNPHLSLSKGVDLIKGSSSPQASCKCLEGNHLVPTNCRIKKALLDKAFSRSKPYNPLN